MFSNDVNLLVHYEKNIKFYTDTMMGYRNLQLSESEVSQLYWYIADSRISPQASAKESVADELTIPSANLSFEVKRCLHKAHCLTCVLTGMSAYEDFTKGQSEQEILSRDQYAELVEFFAKFSEADKDILRAICFITKTDRAEKILHTQHFITDQNAKQFIDSEAFLTLLAQACIDDDKLRSAFPVFKSLTLEAIRDLNFLYWPKMHFRHMLFSEGGNSMLTTFKQGIANETFSQKSFDLWFARWLIDGFAFGIGNQPKYFNAKMHQNYGALASHLKTIFDDPQCNFLDRYLLEKGEPATKQILVDNATQKWLGHLALSFNKIDINEDDQEQWQAVVQGYLQSGCEALPKIYQDFCSYQEAVTPTYLPAVLNNAYSWFVSEGYTSKNSIQLATEFMCKVSSYVYTQAMSQRVSCFDFANQNILPITLKQWLHDKDLKLSAENGFLQHSGNEIQFAFKVI